MSIPASRIVNAIPGVLNAGGNSLTMNGLYLTENLAMPTGTVLSFASAAAVGAFFGLNSAEYAQALIYFAGYNNSTRKPGAMLFAPFNLAARSGFLQGGSLAGLTLTQLQALTGTLTITFAGSALTSSTITLSGDASFSAAAATIQGAFTSPAFGVTYNSTTSAFVFTSTSTGATETIIYATGSLAAGLALTQATGAFLSQGAALDTPASAMNTVVSLSQNWSTLVTMFEPNLSAKEAFAVWFGSQNQQYLYNAWDSDTNASVQGSTASFGYIANAAGYQGVTCISGDPALAVQTGTTLGALALNAASFLAGAIASVNFNQKNGRRTFAFLSSGQIQPTCANDQISQNLLVNGYNFYGAYASRNQGFVFFYNGQMSGPFLSIVRYVGQIYFNSQLELSLLTLLTNVGVGYDPADYGAIRATLQGLPTSASANSGPIAQALNFGIIKTGVQLSSAQISEVNQAAGVNAAPVITTAGYYLQILDPGAPARALGQSPIINLWYTDGGDILQINLASTDVL